MIKQIPNILTLCNLLSGCGAIISVTSEHKDFKLAFWFFCASFIFDSLDGLLARSLNVSSAIGKELDSLADMVSFGVVPGAILYQLIVRSMYLDAQNWMKYLGERTLVTPALPAFLITAFACYRLAKFNTDTRQSDTFLGLATPANTTFIVGLLLVYVNNTLDLGEKIINFSVLYSLIPILCYLQVSEIPMMKFRLKNYNFKGNEMRYVLFGFLVIGSLFFQEGILCIGVIAYIIASIINNLVFEKNIN